MTANLKYLLCAALVGVCCVALVGAATAQIVTTSFQNGVNGYTGTFDRAISDTATLETDLGGVAYGWVDGVDIAKNPPADDRQIFMRFDNIFGTGQNQIPNGATILEAELVLATGLAGNAQTGGPFGVAGLLQAFDSTTSYFMDFESVTDFGSRGAWWQDGYATRPTGGWGFMNPGTIGGANVAPIVQSWANGSPNYGFVIQAGMSDSVAASANSTDGWAIRSTGFPYSDQRPKLAVSYTTAPVVKTSFQEGTNGYTGTTMAQVHSGANALIPDDTEVTNDASLSEQLFLDGVIFTDTAGTTSSPDLFALLKFNNVFGTGAGQAPTTTPVAKAWAVITTGDLSNDARTQGEWAAYTMLRPWDTTTLHSNIGDIPGLQIGDNDIGPALDIQEGFIRGAEIWFDVTEYAEGIRTGATDYGIAIQAYNTGDGWQIYANGAVDPTLRPRLVVYSADLGQVVPLEGDFDGDLDVDGADFLIWQRGFGTTYDAGDLAAWQSNFGTIKTSGPMATAIPEPSTLLLLMGAALAVACARMRSFVA